MPDSRLISPDEATTAELAAQLALVARPGDILCLSGPLGAGKSTFARAFIRARCKNPALEVPSPTFTLVQMYEHHDGNIWHFDLWRLAGFEALEELGWDEAQAGIVLVEWPERLGSQTPINSLSITISPNPAGREIRVQGDPRWFDAS
ncbi:MAG TPA: tRNA (adenosine(37)-N6)-threonylcarbamoyltransferase complex ATPase subunit type 1 TsaE [Acidocella sp.]|nr:MAG: tRNA (adenosine(37)-N6)-threonylcarbamoyltransferase complex ATPase subunit type 1 TsaE [Acidocella sp. 20-58-15]HQT38157.1 tRNA (adenosine(37)-N6)-threonylcarbamoyltransferase complex ATPase subunit type 1 TsaE [Acidocella sp.]